MGCLERRITGAFNISGLSTLDYIDLMRAVKKRCRRQGARSSRSPTACSGRLLLTYALVDKRPALHGEPACGAWSTPDLFEVIDWPGIFGVTPTPLDAAFRETFNDPRFASVVLEF